MENNKDSHICPNCGHVNHQEGANRMASLDKNPIMTEQQNVTHQMASLDKSLMMSKRIPRGRKLPKPFLYTVKIAEGRNTLNAIAKAYSVSQANLSRVINGKRNTKHLIDILEFEYKLPIDELRALIKNAKTKNRELALKIQEEALKGESRWP